MLARLLDAPARVTLRLPPPLDRPLTAVTTYDGGVELRDGEGEGSVVVAVADRRSS